MPTKKSVPELKDKKVKSQIGKKVRQILIAEIARYSTFDSAKTAYDFFQKHHNLAIGYDSFWYHLGEAKKEVAKDPSKKHLLKEVSMTKAPTKKVVIPNDEEDNDEVDEVVLPSLYEKEATAEDIEIKVYDPQKDKINEEDFIPMKSDLFIDTIFSEEGGVMPGSIIVVPGGPSTGKTTTTLFIQDNMKMVNPKLDAMYLSSEMEKRDLQREQRKKPWMARVKTILMSDYETNQYKGLLEKVITLGYDHLVIDSLNDIVDRLVHACHMTQIEATNYMMRLMKNAADGKTKNGKKTAIFVIQQVTKGGVFVGKNSLKHNTTGMWEFFRDAKTRERYAMFTKYREHSEMEFRKVYITLNSKKEIVFDKERFEEELKMEEIVSGESARNDESRDSFTKKFLSANTQTFGVNDGNEDDE